jgi:hypothetical protein
MNFAASISDAQTNLEKDGFKTTLWIPEWAIPTGEEESFADPHPPQLLAALQVFAWLFVSSINRVWVHIAAEMQAGKTGVIAAVARLLLSNARRLGFAPNRIFVVTGMSDEAWQKQTAPRLPGILRENIHHGGTLSQVAAKLARLANGGRLSNVLIFIDESHYATSTTNQPARHVYDAVARECPREFWAENNIRFVTISATDPAKVLAMKSAETSCHVVRLHTTDAYQSVEKLQSNDRIRFLEQIPKNGALHTEAGLTVMANAVQALEATHGPLIHILRPNHGKGGLVSENLRRMFPSAIVHQWDVASNKERRARDDGSSGVGSATDINIAILNDKPDDTTFVILKGMFRAAKTLNDEHVGVLYDRVGAGDATNLQSLLGRACGYGKSTRSVVFTSRSTVDNYLRLWRELCASKDFLTEGTGDVFSGLKGRMPGVTSVTTASGEAIRLVTTATHATPFGAGIGSATAEELAASRAVGPAEAPKVDHRIYRTEEDACGALKMMYPRFKKMHDFKKDEAGFFKASVNAPVAVNSLARTVQRIGNVTGGTGTTATATRCIPCYESTADITTLRYVVRVPSTLSAETLAVIDAKYPQS